MPPLVLPFPAIDPVLIQIGPFALRWYALAYIVGILLGWMYARAITRRDSLWGGKAPMTVAAAASSAFGTFLRTCQTPCSFLISSIPTRILDPTA